jgi:hypothetical protein
MMTNQKKRSQKKKGVESIGYHEPLLGPYRVLDDGQSYRLQQGTTLWLPGAEQIVGCNAAGNTASSITISKNNITNFNTRIATVFTQYRILGCDIQLIPLSTTAGAMVFFFDEKVTTAPTAADASERIVEVLPHSQYAAKPRTVMKWRAKDIVDLSYLDVSAGATTIVTFKSYTSVAFGTPAATVANMWLVKPILLVEVRGIMAL